jgi:hypothetical protein
LSEESEETEEAVQVVVLEERAAEGEPVAQVVEGAALREVPPEALREPQRARQEQPPERRQEP